MHLKEAWSTYLNHFLSILLIGVTIILPLELVSFTFSSNFYALFGLNGQSLLAGMVIQVFFLNLMQVPLIYLASRVINDEQASLLKLYRNFVLLIVPVTIMNVYYLLTVSAGTILLILPGIFMFILAFLYPYVAVIDHKQGAVLFKRTFWIGRSHAVDMGVIMLTFVCLNVLAGTLFEYLIDWIGISSFGGNIIFHFAINALILPFFVFVVTINYFDWSEESIENVEESEWQY